MSGVVLMYHRVANVEDDLYGLAVHPQRFGDHIEYLMNRGCVVPLGDLLNPASSARIAVTFDDGYADNAITAAPLLAAAGLPATYFITTGTLGGRRFWWDRLAAALLGEHPLPDGVDVRVGGRQLWLSLNSPLARRTAVNFLHRRLRPLPPDQLEAVVDGLLARLRAPQADDGLTMSTDQLQGIADLPLVEIGAHTRTHLQLAGQREALQRQEIIGSVSDLSSLLGRPVTAFAYPFGSSSAVGTLAPKLAREAGCSLACSTHPGTVSSHSQRYSLPRLNVRDWNAGELATHIKQLTTNH